MTTGNSTAVRAVRWTLIGAGLALPALSLVPFGSYWLWERGFLIYWAIAACLSTVFAWAMQRWLLGPVRTKMEADEPIVSTGDTDVDPSWTPAEAQAWSRVQEIVKTIDPEALESRGDVIELGQRTVETVATAIHPERKDPLLQFTAPEALALIERVSARMNAFVRESVPLGDRLTLAQMRALYEWKGAIDIAEQAWGVWRVLRLINPASALATEVRERISKELMAWGKSHVARQLATVFITEVGRAAIDLYGGRLRVASDRLAGHVTAGSARDLSNVDATLSEPLRLLVAGQVSAGKSSLVNALAKEVRAAVDSMPTTNQFTPYRLDREGLPAALIVDSPGIGTSKKLDAGLIEEAARSDLVLWVVAANRADREADRATLQALRDYFAQRPERRAPPILLVMTHVDRLRPFNEWRPPYDLNDTASAKAASIRAVVEAAAGELGFASADVVPCCLAEWCYNVDAVWAAILAKLPEAQRTRLLRTLRDAEVAWDWQRIWSQAKTGGRVLAKAIRP